MARESGVMSFEIPSLDELAPDDQIVFNLSSSNSNTALESQKSLPLELSASSNSSRVTQKGKNNKKGRQLRPGVPRVFAGQAALHFFQVFQAAQKPLAHYYSGNY